MKLIPFLLTLLIASYPIKLALGSFAVPDGGVTTQKIANNAVTRVKLAPMTVQTPAPTATPAPSGGIAISASSSSFTTTSASFTDVTNLSVSIVTTGRPIFVGLIPDGSGAAAYIRSSTGSSTTSYGSFLELTDNSNTDLYDFTLQGSPGVTTTGSANAMVPPSAFSVIIPEAAGTYTFKVRGEAVSGTTLSVNLCKLMAYEL